MTRSTRLFHVLILFTGLTGCSTVPQQGPFVANYERQFRQDHPYVEHSVPRGGGSTIHAREFGHNHSARGPAILLMHGFPDSLHLYDLLIPPLAEERQVIAFDFLGWGYSDKPANHRYDVASLRSDLEAVIQHFGLKSIVLVVHDLSGQPGIDWALANEDRIETLVLLNTYYSPMASLNAPEAIARFSTPGLWRDLSVWFASRSDAAWQSGVQEQIEKFFVNPVARETFVRIFVHQALGIRPAFFGQNAVLPQEIAAREKDLPRLKQFRKPVRIIFGNEDRYLNAGVARELQGLFPKSALFLIDNAAHYVQLDQPHQVASLILSTALHDQWDKRNIWRSGS